MIEVVKIVRLFVLVAAAAAASACQAVSVLRNGREGLVRCRYSETEDMVVSVRHLANEWVYIVPKGLPTREFAKGDYVHGGSDDFCAIHLGDFGFMSGNHGSFFAHHQTVSNHAFSVSDIGSAVKHESGERYVLVAVPDKDHILLHPEGKAGVRPCFPYLTTGSFSCGERKWTPSDTVRGQLYPMNRFRKFVWKTADGCEVPDGREVASGRIDLEIEHDVLDPRGVMAYLKSHPGKTGRVFGTAWEQAHVDTPAAAAEAGDFMKIPALLHVKTTYSYDDYCCRLVRRETTFVAPLHQASVLDVCHSQGEEPAWEDVSFYIPRLKPVTLTGVGGAPDVVCDFTSVEKMPIPPWNVNTNLKRRDAADFDNPPDRFVRILSRKQRRLGVALGYSLLEGVSRIGDKWPERDVLYLFWDTGKMYPYLLSLQDVPAGKTYRHCAYTQYFDPAVEPDATDFYCHRESDSLVVYMDFHKTLAGKRIRLPRVAAGRPFEILEKTPSVTLHAKERIPKDGIALDVADGYGTLVLRVRLSD